MPIAPDRKQRLLNTALERIGCTLQQATICYLLLNRELGGQEWTELSIAELARRPDRLCCSQRDAEIFLKRVIAVGLVERCPDDDWYYRLDWNRITAIAGTTSSPTAA